MVDELFSIDDWFQRGKSLPYFGFQNNVFKDVEPSPDLVPLIDPKYISRCCTEHGRIPTVPVYFKFSYGEAIEFASMLEDVDNLLYLPIMGNVDLFYYDIHRAYVEVFNVLKKGVPTSPRISHRKRFAKEFLYASILQIFLWEHIINLKIRPYLCNAAKSRFVIDSVSYVPKRLPLACRCVVYGEDASVKLIPLFENLDFPSLIEKLLAFLALLVPFLGKENEEKSAVYAHFRVRQQFGFEHRVPLSFPSIDVAYEIKKLGHLVKSKTVVAKALVAHAGLARRIRGAQVSASFDTSKLAKYLHVTDASEDELNTGDVANDETSFGKGVDDDVSEEKPSGKSGGNVNFDEVDGFLNDDVQVNVENVEVGGLNAVASFPGLMVIGGSISLDGA
ncbi:hypothetical protein C1H46_012477 [Malus baccata]|uniref:Aminotransferase-like plant mobile domain-containing protein n=1 Tax=Malus baccata TaxID=106549 RepID=A0A540MUE8_MALBA|nr:hypothetical protein C1H46_012477 [Malus baccata]